MVNFRKSLISVAFIFSVFHQAAASDDTSIDYHSIVRGFNIAQICFRVIHFVVLNITALPKQFKSWNTIFRLEQGFIIICS
jgi:hypothetical protein